MKDHHTTPAHFELFQKECRKWIKFFELGEWRYHFRHKKMEDDLAICASDTGDLVATITLNINWAHDKVTIPSLKRVARHEIVHILTARLEWLATCRYLNPDILSQEVEGLAHKIEAIIDKLGAR